MKQYTEKEFANNIRSKYPGSYDDLSDVDLVELWLKKFPRDRNKVIPDLKDESNGSYGWILFLILLAVMFFTNPSAMKHRSAVNESVQGILGNKVEKYEFLKNLMDNDYVKNLIEAGLNTNVKRTNYFIFSLTEIKFDDSDYTIIGVGAFGYVHIFSQFEDELENMLTNAEKLNPFSS
jgi:hypothetical protein